MNETAANKISERLDALYKPVPCDNGCKNWAKYLEHRDRACVLSDVYSVRKGDPCTTRAMQEGLKK